MVFRVDGKVLAVEPKVRLISAVQLRFAGWAGLAFSPYLILSDKGLSALFGLCFHSDTNLRYVLAAVPVFAKGRLSA